MGYDALAVHDNVGILGVDDVTGSRKILIKLCDGNISQMLTISNRSAMPAWPAVMVDRKPAIITYPNDTFTHSPCFQYPTMLDLELPSMRAAPECLLPSMRAALNIQGA